MGKCLKISSFFRSVQASDVVGGCSIMHTNLTSTDLIMIPVPNRTIIASLVLNDRISPFGNTESIKAIN